MIGSRFSENGKQEGETMNNVVLSGTVFQPNFGTTKSGKSVLTFNLSYLLTVVAKLIDVTEGE